MSSPLSKLSTAGGMLAVVLWSSSVCVCGSLIPKLGTFTTAGLVYLIAGLLSTAALLLSGHIDEFTKISLKRLLLCGTPFILYIVLFYLATGMTHDGRLLIEVGLLNYLWPALSILLSIPLQGNRATLILPLGVAASLFGIFMMSSAFNETFGLNSLFADFAKAPLPCALAFVAALLWGLYCNVTRMLEKEATNADIPAFMLISGMILLPFGPLLGEKPMWDSQTLPMLLGTALLPGYLACVLWDWAARKGNFILVSSFAYLAPVFSTVMTGVFFGVELRFGVWLACASVVIGAWLCQVSVRQRE